MPTEGLSEERERMLLEEIEMHKRARSHLTGLAAKKERRAEVAEARVDELLAENERLSGALERIRDVLGGDDDLVLDDTREIARAALHPTEETEGEAR